MANSRQELKKIEPEELLSLAERRRASADKWFRYRWGWHQFLTSVGWGLSALVPFVLAAMLYLPSGDTQRLLNLVAILVSGLAFFCLSQTTATRLRERAELNREIAGILAVTMAEYKGKLIPISVLRAKVQAVYRLEGNEPSA